ncbi:MAG: hypothetical protein M1450_04400 [Patescibacteria group bacterium]|nr:hypothetical protein [Patescibacteria group bacterium]
MKKILLIVGIVLVIITIGIPIFVSIFILPNIKRETSGNFPQTLEAQKEYVDKNSEPWIQSKGMKYLGFEEVTDLDLRALKSGTDLTRRYPTSIKAVFDPGAISNTVDLLYYSDELGDLGVNTFWVIGEYRMKNYKAYQFSPSFSHLGFPQLLSDQDANKVIAWRLLLAKKLGFATILIPDYPSLFNIGRENFDLTKVEPEFKRVALELAKIAEECRVEYLAPVNEYNHLLISNGYSMDEIVENEKRFYGDLLPKIRAIFHGKVVIKNGAVNDWNNFKRQSMVGADLFGVGNAFTGIRTRENMLPKVQAANFVSARDNVPWFESEFVVYRPIDQEHWMGVVQSTAPMENTYREGLDIFEREAQGAIGFTFMSWTGVGKIRGTAVSQVMKDFFERWQPTAKLTPDIKIAEAAVGGRNASIVDWFLNLPSYYSFAFKLLTGQMGPGEKDPSMGEGSLPCKGKEECEIYCAKPENRTECEKARGNESQNGEMNKNKEPGNQNQGEMQGGPGGCKSQSECQAYCSQPQNREECSKFQSPN